MKWIPLVLFTLFVSYGINWDQGFLLHPDERFLVVSAEQWSREYFDTHFFVYGTLPTTVVNFLHHMLPGYRTVLFSRGISIFSFWLTIIAACFTA